MDAKNRPKDGEVTILKMSKHETDEQTDKVGANERSLDVRGS